MTNTLLMTLLLLVASDFHETHGYGRMIAPLSRSSTWRKNFLSQVNLADGYVNCGGPIIQYGKNIGRCGECGDDYSLQRPRPNENGGVYGKGMIAHVYRKSSFITVTVQLSGDLQGWFNFDVCPLTSDEIESEDCFKSHRLRLAERNGYNFKVTRAKEELRNIEVALKLPWKLTCTHCVLRWKFRSVNGDFEPESDDQKMSEMTDTSATWRNCADIAILRPNSLHFTLH